MNWKELLLNFISNPNVAYLLILLSIYGIFFELKSPGSIFPGTVGGISILLASYSLQMMEINYIGLGLIILAFIFFVLEIFIISYGMLSIGGIISLTIGSVMLIDSPYEYLRISMIYIIIASMVTGILIAIIIFYGYKSQKSKILNGKNSLIGQTGICKSEISPTKSGVILVQGEIWNAISEDFIKQDDKVDIISVDSMILTVKKTLS
jgi:membrane-bound serine protease (ClpP class)